MSFTVTEPVVPVVGPGMLPVVQIGLLPAVHVTVTPLSTLNGSDWTSARPVADALRRYVPVGAVIERSLKVASPAPAVGSTFESVPAEVVAAGTYARLIVPEYHVTVTGLAPPLLTATLTFVAAEGSNATFVIVWPGSAFFGCAVNASEQFVATVVTAGVGSGLMSGRSLFVPLKSLDCRTSVRQL